MIADHAAAYARGLALMAEWAIEDEALEIIEHEALRARLAGRPSGLWARLHGHDDEPMAKVIYLRRPEQGDEQRRAA